MKTIFNTIPRLAKIFSEGNFLDTIRLCVCLWYFIVSRKLLGLRKDFQLRVLLEGKKVILFLRYPMDIAVLTEIFIIKEYEWCPLRPAVIFDLGAHFGDTALYYQSRFPEAKIVAVEPSSENYQRLVKHTESFKNISTVNAAVGSEDGETILNLTESTLGHSVMRRDNLTSSLTVPQISLESLMKDHEVANIDLLKFDIEGAEFSLLDSIAKMPIRALIGELHFDLVNGWDIDLVKEKLSQYNVSIASLNQPGRYVIMAVKNSQV